MPSIWCSIRWKQVSGYFYVDDVVVTSYGFAYTGVDVGRNAICVLRSFEVKLTADLNEVMGHTKAAGKPSLSGAASQVA